MCSLLCSASLHALQSPTTCFICLNASASSIACLTGASTRASSGLPTTNTTPGSPSTRRSPGRLLCSISKKQKDAPELQFSSAAMLQDGRCPSNRMCPTLTRMIGDSPKDAIRVARIARVNRYEKVSVGDLVQVGTSEPPVIGFVASRVDVPVGAATQVPLPLRDVQCRKPFFAAGNATRKM